MALFSAAAPLLGSWFNETAAAAAAVSAADPGQDNSEMIKQWVS